MPCQPNRETVGDFGTSAPVESQQVGAGVGDLDGDGHLDLIVGKPVYGHSQAGALAGSASRSLVTPPDGTFYFGWSLASPAALPAPRPQRR